MDELYHLNYRISDIDRPHALNITNMVELPFGRGTGGWTVVVSSRR